MVGLIRTTFWQFPSYELAQHPCIIRDSLSRFDASLLQGGANLAAGTDVFCSAANLGFYPFLQLI